MAHVDFLLRPQPLKPHLAIVAILALWMASSAGFHLAVERVHGGGLVRVGSVLAEVMFLTAILRIVGTPLTPMVVAYPLVIAASALWYREAIVWIATLASCAGYMFLVADTYRRGHNAPMWDHLAVFCASIIVLGAAVAFLVRRVRLLTRYSRRRG